MDKHIIYKNIKVSYNLVGKGQTIVFLHGYLETKEIWRKFSEKLSAKNHQILCVDLLGHGKTGDINDTHTMENMADAVFAIVKHLSLHKIILIGHSMGGYVTLAFAEKYENYLRGYSLLHSSAKKDTVEKKINRLREINLINNGKKELIFDAHISNTFAKDNHQKYEEDIMMITASAKKISNRGITAALRGMMKRTDRQKILSESSVPVLFVLGAKDNLLPIELVLKQTKLSPLVSKKILKKSGHMGFIEEEEKTLKIIHEFIHKIPQ